MATITKTGRISVKLTHDAAETLCRAAALSGSSLNGFLVQAALKEARRVLDREEEAHRSAGDPAILVHFAISRLSRR